MDSSAADADLVSGRAADWRLDEDTAAEAGNSETGEPDEDTALLDAAADFIGLVRDHDVDTLRLGVDRCADIRPLVLIVIISLI